MALCISCLCSSAKSDKIDDEEEGLATMIKNDYEDYSDTVLYDVFYEAGTMLGGWLSAAQDRAESRGDEREAKALFQEQLDLNLERDSVDARDRVAQITKIKKWHARRAELDAQKLPVAV